MKTVNIFGGGTVSHVRSHLALCAPAYGTTARILQSMCIDRFKDMDTHLFLTKMADFKSTLETNNDIEYLVEDLKKDFNTKVVFFNVAMCDWDGYIMEDDGIETSASGNKEPRLRTDKNSNTDMALIPSTKIIGKVRQGRKDIFLVGFKATCGATEAEQYQQGLLMMKRSSANLVLANDVKTKVNMIITPEEARYHITNDREEALKQLVDMAYYRSHLSFTRSTVVDGEPVPWDTKDIYPSLFHVVNYCITRGAYKPFNGATVGHFACKIGEGEFLTSIRKSNFNDLWKNGLVRVKIDGEDTVMAYGAKPSVGGQSQRIVFAEHADHDCIVHFHCPLKADCDEIPVISQREYECGSHECGQNTSNGLRQFGNLLCVMLDNHGPNIVFNHNIDPAEVISFIERNFDLDDKTGGTF